MQVPDRQEGEKGTEKIFGEIMAPNHLKFGGKYSLPRVPVRRNKHATPSLPVNAAIKIGLNTGVAICRLKSQ